MQRKGSSSRQSRGRTHRDQRGLSPGREIQRISGVDDNAAPRLREDSRREPLEYGSASQNRVSFATRDSTVLSSPSDHTIENEALRRSREGPHSQTVDNLSNLWITCVCNSALACLGT